MHLDPDEYYGGSHASLTLQEADEWAAKHSASDERSIFSAAMAVRNHDASALSFSRAYSLALAPQLIHARAELISQLVSSRAFRHLEFLSVGSCFVFKPEAGDEATSTPTLARIPSSREAIFSNTTIPARSKRQLMKFLKFVVEHDTEPQSEQWKAHAQTPLAEFLASEFGLDNDLRTYILALTLSLDGLISTQDGLAVLQRHLTSMGMFGPGFAAVYPKWGGSSEIAQVACRAGAVGGAVYMLGTKVDRQELSAGSDDISMFMSNDMSFTTKLIIGSVGTVEPETPRISRLIAVIGSPLPSLFETVVEGQPTPAVAVVAVPAGSALGEAEHTEYPIYITAHSGETGECPTGQSILHLTTLRGSADKSLLNRCLELLLSSLSKDHETPMCLYKLYYEQAQGPVTLEGKSKLNSGSDVDVGIASKTFNFPIPSVDLAFDDTILEPVLQAWQQVMGLSKDDAESEYMKFQDRDGMGDDDDVYE